MTLKEKRDKYEALLRELMQRRLRADTVAHVDDLFGKLEQRLLKEISDGITVYRNVRLKMIDSGLKPRIRVVNDTLEFSIPRSADGNPGKDGRDGKDGRPGRDGKSAPAKKMTPAEIRDALSRLLGNDRLDATHIKNLPVIGGFSGGGSGVSSFLALSDTPSSYVGQAGKLVSVKSDSTGLEFATESYVNVSGDTMTGLLQWSGTDHAGLRLNNLTTTQQNNLVGASGNLIFNTSLAAVRFFDGSDWVSLVDSNTAIDHGTLTGLTDDDHSQYIHNTPTSTTRNLITAANATAKHLVLKSSDNSTSQPVFQILDSAGTTPYFAILANGNTAIGFSAYPSASYQLSVNPQYTDPVGAARAFSSVMTTTFTSSYASIAAGVVMIANAGGTGALTATIGLRGGYFIAQKLGNNAITGAAAGVFKWSDNGSGGTTTNAYGMYVESPLFSATTTNYYHIYLQAPNDAATRYAILSEGGNVVFNENGTSTADFRIEGDTNTNLFFLDASADAIGINNSAPVTKIDISTATATQGALSMTSTDGSTTKKVFQVIDDSGTFVGTHPTVYTTDARGQTTMGGTIIPTGISSWVGLTSALTLEAGFAASTSSTWTGAAYQIINYSTGNPASMVGMSANLTTVAASTVDLMTCFSGSYRNLGSTVPEAYGVKASLSLEGGYTVLATGIYVAITKSGGATYQGYGIHINNVSSLGFWSILTDGGWVEHNAGSATTTPLYIDAAASQTADLTQWRDSSDTVMAGITSDGRVFSGLTSAVSGAQLSFSRISSSTTASIFGVYGNARASATSIYDVYGGYLQAETTASYSGLVVGLYSLSQSVATASVGTVIGVYGHGRVANTGAVTSVVGVKGYIDDSGGGAISNAIVGQFGYSVGVNTVTTAYGIQILSGSGTNVTTNAGLYINDQANGSTNYSIYTGAGTVSIGDHVKIRTDSKYLYFGTGDDATITYDGTNMIINPKVVGSGYLGVSGNVQVGGVLSLLETTAPGSTSGYGKLYVKSSDSLLYFMDDGGSEYSLTAAGTPSGWTDDGTVVRLTTSTDNVTIGSATGGGKLFIDGDTDEVQLQVQAHSTQTGLLSIWEKSDGTDVITFSGLGAAVFNESGADADFRVEGDTDTNLIFADASADFTGVGTGSPNEKLTVGGRLSLQETTAPSNTSGFGKFYVKSSDSRAYFLDDGGTEYGVGVKVVAEQAIASTITWTGTTAPSGATNHYYTWTQHGRMVTVFFRLEYASGGSGLTAVTIDFMSDLPTPLEPTGVGSNDEIVYSGSAQLFTGSTGNPQITRAVIKRNSGSTGHQFHCVGASLAYIGVVGWFQYLTS